jgi:hypothetical protein
MESQLFDDITNAHKKVTELYRQRKYKEARKILSETQYKLNKYHASIRKEWPSGGADRQMDN